MIVVEDTFVIEDHKNRWNKVVEVLDTMEQVHSLLAIIFDSFLIEAVESKDDSFCSTKSPSMMNDDFDHFVRLI